MKTSVPKLKSVKLKNGCDVVLFKQPLVTEKQHRLVRAATVVANTFHDSISAYVVIAFDDHGQFAAKVYRDDDSLFGMTMIPQMVKDAILRSIVEDAITPEEIN